MLTYEALPFMAQNVADNLVSALADLPIDEEATASALAEWAVRAEPDFATALPRLGAAARWALIERIAMAASERLGAIDAARGTAGAA